MKISDIIVSHRVRTDLGDIDFLKDSIEKYGLLHPIIVDSKNRLISGERRLTAIKELGWEEVDVIVKNVTYEEALNIELTENITRKDFLQEEVIKGIKKRKQLSSKNPFKRFWFYLLQLFNK